MHRYDAREIAALFDRGESVINRINAQEGTQQNSSSAILYSYDAQAGTYVAELEDPAHRDLKHNLGRYLAAVIDTLRPSSLLDAGVGEATSLVPLLGYLQHKPEHVLGFDISLSRLLFARRHLADNGNEAVLFTGTLDRIALETDSVDVIVTVHALEPNHGHEDVILSELLRVARRHLVLVEPSYELASPEARARMERLGYVRGLPERLKCMGHAPTRVERCPYNSNPLNEAALIVVDKPHAAAGEAKPPTFISPISGRQLVPRLDCWFCPGDGHAFPVIAGIPCLLVDNSVLASKLESIGQGALMNRGVAQARGSGPASGARRQAMANVKQVATAVQQFLIEPMRKRSGSLFLLQLAQLVTDRGRGRYDDLMCRALAAVRPKIDLPASRFMSDGSIANSVNTLQQRGWDILPWQVDSADLAEIRRFAFTMPAYAADPSEHIIIEEGNIPKRDGRYVWRMSDLIRVAAVQKLITDGAMHRIAQDYLRCRPLLSSIVLWLDPPYDRPIDAHQYHYDNDGPSFLKFFVYVTDIDETGAHSFIQGTHSHCKPPQFGRSGIYDRNRLLQFYGGENEKVFTGPAGMILAEDTAGFHKGTTPRKGYRMILQFQFTSLDHPLDEEFVCGVDKVRIEGVDRGIRQIASKFVA